MQAIAASNADLVTEAAAKLTADGEPDYPSIAAQLAPQRDTAAISHAADVVKFAVAYSGRVKCASTAQLGENTNSGGIVELLDLHAPMANPQKVVFDPADFLGYGNDFDMYFFYFSLLRDGPLTCNAPALECALYFGSPGG